MKNYLNILIIVLITNLSFSQTTPKKIDSILKTAHQEHPNIGISIGYIIDGKEYYTSVGKINRVSNIDIDKNSVFEIASITKALTGNLIAQAILENKISADDFIDAYLPVGIKLQEPIKNKIRISDLASHQSGLPDINFRKLITLNPQQPVSSVDKNEIISILNTCSELSDFGNYRYSTMGFILLGQILETVYNKTYDEIIHNKIITPLHLKNTLTKRFNVTNKTTGYNPEGGIQEFFEWNITASAGLIKSNTSDMIAYLKSILSEESNVSKAASIAENTFYKNTRIEIGLGINIIHNGENTVYAKTGDTMGQSSVMGYNKTKKRGIIILMNQRDSKLRNNLFNKIYESFLIN